MCVFRYAHGSSVHHFEVDPARSRVRIWAVWLIKGQLLFEGKYDTDRTIVLTGRLPGTGQPATLELIRVRPSRGRLTESPPLHKYERYRQCFTFGHSSGRGVFRPRPWKIGEFSHGMAYGWKRSPTFVSDVHSSTSGSGSSSSRITDSPV
jgi:hypothetical protein